MCVASKNGQNYKIVTTTSMRRQTWYEKEIYYSLLIHRDSLAMKRRVDQWSRLVEFFTPGAPVNATDIRVAAHIRMNKHPNAIGFNPNFIGVVRRKCCIPLAKIEDSMTICRVSCQVHKAVQFRSIFVQIHSLAIAWRNSSYHCTRLSTRLV